MRLRASAATPPTTCQKSITLETGITVQAPLFIKTGEKIKVDTRTGKYMERA
jgi:elongation factor P